MIHWEDYREEGLPEILMQYRAVADHPVADEPCPTAEKSLIGIRNLFTDKNPEYWRQRTSLETAYEERKKAEALLKAKEAALQAPTTTVLSEWDGKGLCPTCKRGEVAADPSTMAQVEKVKRWLDENGA